MRQNPASGITSLEAGFENVKPFEFLACESTVSVWLEMFSLRVLLRFPTAMPSGLQWILTL